MQIAINIPPQKADFMIEMLSNFSFVEDVFTNTHFTNTYKEIIPQPQRKIGLLDGIGDVVFKDNWEMSEEELLGAR
jgi:hypothetical protein